MFQSTTANNKTQKGFTTHSNSFEEAEKSSQPQRIHRTGFDGPAPVDFFKQESHDSEPAQLAAAKDDEELQMKPKEEEELPIQGKNIKEDELQKKSASSSGSNSMPQDVQAKMESSFGTDFSNVNIHANDQSAPQMGALAYTQGNDVHFAPGQYNPGSQKGQELLGHELTHVVQQRQGRVQPTRQGKDISINDSPVLEKEADVMGAKAAQGRSAEVSGTGSGVQRQTIQMSGPSWWDTIKKGAGIYLGLTLKDEGSAYAKALMRHYALGGGSEFNPQTSSINFPTDAMWDTFMSSRPEIKNAMFNKFSSLALLYSSKEDGTYSFSGNITNVRLNQLESMRWTLHGCHRIDISGNIKVSSNGTDKNITFENMKFNWIDVGDMHPGTTTETDSGEQVDDAELTGAGSAFPINIPFSMPGTSIWEMSGSGTLQLVSGWPH